MDDKPDNESTAPEPIPFPSKGAQAQPDKPELVQQAQAPTHAVAPVTLEITKHPAEHFSVYYSMQPDNLPNQNDPHLVYITLRDEAGGGLLQINRGTGNVVWFPHWNHRTAQPAGAPKPR